jgi:DnaJ domain
LAAILYLLGWLPKGNTGKLAAWVRKFSGVLFVSGAAFILTRNIGFAILGAMLAYSLMGKGSWLQGSTRRTGGMKLEEAYNYLGLKPGATRDEIHAAHRDQIKRNHPDQGGATYIAAKLNEAKDVLLKHVQA